MTESLIRECQKAHGEAVDWLVQILPAKIEALIKTREWEGVTNKVTGKPFASFYELATTKIPHGLGFDGVNRRLTYEDVIRYCRLQRSDVAKMLLLEVPAAAGVGRPAKAGSDCKNVDNINILAKQRESNGGTDPLYLASRIKRDAPEVAEAFERGEFGSVYAAAKAAGIIKVATPFERAMKSLTKLDQAELRAVAAKASQMAEEMAQIQ